MSNPIRNALIGLMATATIFSGAATAHAAPHTAPGNEVYHETFDNLSDEWFVYNNTGSYHEYISNAVKAENGNLVITSQRHCLDEGEERSDKNASVKPCGLGKKTDYSSGRVENRGKIDGTKSYRMDIRAKIDGNGLTNNQPALWIRNDNAHYCQKESTGPLGEFDLLENWGEPNRTHSGVFLGCYRGAEESSGKEKGLFRVTQAEFNQPDMPVLGDWHVWSIIYDKQGKTIEYLFDGKPVPKDVFWDTKFPKSKAINLKGTGSKIDLTDKNYKLTEEQLNEILDQPYTIILNDHIRTGKNAPDDKKDYPKQTLYVDDIKIVQYDKSPYDLSDVDQNTPKPSNTVDVDQNTPKPGNTVGVSNEDGYTEMPDVSSSGSSSGTPTLIGSQRSLRDMSNATKKDGNAAKDAARTSRSSDVPKAAKPSQTAPLSQAAQSLPQAAQNANPVGRAMNRVQQSVQGAVQDQIGPKVNTGGGVEASLIQKVLSIFR